MHHNLAFNILGLGLAAFIITCFIAACILIFEIWMFIDAIRNPRIPHERRLLWLIGMLLIHPFVAIAYYFTDRRPPASRA